MCKPNLDDTPTHELVCVLAQRVLDKVHHVCYYYVLPMLLALAAGVMSTYGIYMTARWWFGAL